MPHGTLYNGDGSNYCCQNLQKGGMCIFVRKDQSYNNYNKIDILLHSTEQTLEISAIQLETNLYRAPSADFNQFIKRLDATLKYLCNSKYEFLTCGNKNVNYLNNNWEEKLLLRIYNLSHTVNFATRIQNYSSTAIDNIFYDTTKVHSSFPSPVINGLSYHDAEFQADALSSNK
jgi:hypothetical protein